MTDNELGDEEFERLVSGQPPENTVDMFDAVRFVQDLHSVCVYDQPPAQRQQHLAAIRAELHDPAPQPARRGWPAFVPALPNRSAGHIFADALGAVATKAAIVATAVTISAGGMAAAGILPQPLAGFASQAATGAGLGPTDSVSAEPGDHGPERGGVTPAEPDPASIQAAPAPAIVQSPEPAAGTSDALQRSLEDAVESARRCAGEVTADLGSVSGAGSGPAPAQPPTGRDGTPDTAAAGCTGDAGMPPPLPATDAAQLTDELAGAVERVLESPRQAVGDPADRAIEAPGAVTDRIGALLDATLPAAGD